MIVQRVNIKGRLVWVTQVTRGGTIVAACDPLGLTLEADDMEELRPMIAETLHFLLLDLFQEGDMEGFLRAHGWSLSTPVARTTSGEMPRFDVPFELRQAHA
jgi:hypothetical protein